MSELELIRTLFEYNEAANIRLLQAAAGLGEEELGADRGASFGSISSSMAHVGAAQTVWLQRWTAGVNPQPARDIQRMTDMSAIQTALASSHKALRQFAAGLTEERLDAPLAYRDSRGNAFEAPLWVLMTHVVNHGTQHRSEVAMVLTALGRSPGDLDLSHYYLGQFH